MQFLAAAAAGNLPSDTVALLLALKLLASLPQFLPLSLYLAVLLALGRMYKDNEMAALMACGVGTINVLKGVLLFALLFSAITFLVTFYVAPWAEAKSEQVVNEVESSSDFSGIAPGRFKEADDGKWTLYVESYSEQGEMRNLFAQGTYQGRQAVLVSASAFRSVDAVSGDHFLVAEQGYRYEGEPGALDFKITQFDRHGVLIRQKMVMDAGPRGLGWPSSVLWQGQEIAQIVELQRRLSVPLSVLLLAALAVPLSRTSPRQGKYSKLFSAILIYVIYSNASSVALSWLEQEKISPLVGVWWVHGLFTLALLLYLMSQYRLSWLLQRLTGRAPQVKRT